MAAESLKARVLSTILLTFGALTAVIAGGMFVALNWGLERDLEAQAEVIAHALSQSAEVSVGARQGNRRQIDDGLTWLTLVGEDLVSAVVMTPSGKPLAGIGPRRVLSEADLLTEASRPISYTEVEYRGRLTSEAASGGGTDTLDAIASEAPVAPRGEEDPQVRVVMTRKNQLVRQTAAVVLTGVLLCLLAIAALARITGAAFRRLEPAFEQARRMAQGDFSQRIGPIGGLFKRRWSMGIGRARLGS